jgi:isoamylase
MRKSLPGLSFPIGPAPMADGVNFCLFSKHAEQVELLLFKDVEVLKPTHVIPLLPQVNKTYHYWHVLIPGIKAGQLYGYRISGSDDRSKGHVFNPDIVLLDPYAKAVAIPRGKTNSTHEKCGVRPGAVRLAG